MPDMFIKIPGSGFEGESEDSRRIDWSSSTRTKLQQAGMSVGGIEALTRGGPIFDNKDQRIVAAIVKQALG